LPISIAINPTTNKIYVVSYNANGVVTEIDGDTNAATAIPVGSYPYGIDVNTVTNKIYVTNGMSNSVTVIDGATRATTTIPVGVNPTVVAVNATTNTIYVVNGNLDGTISVIDGASNAVTGNFFAGLEPAPTIAVNPVSNTIFAIAGANSLYAVTSATVYQIDGVTGDISEVATGTSPLSLAVNPVAGQLYILNLGDADVANISSSTGRTTFSPLEFSGTAVAVNTATGKAYFANGVSISELDAATLSAAIIPIGGSLIVGIAVDPTSNVTYATSFFDGGTLTAIDDDSGFISTLSVGSKPNALAVNPTTHKVYILNNDALGTVSVLQGIPPTFAPVITGEPLPQTVNTGSTVVFNAGASARPAATYQWAFNGIPLSDGDGVSGSTGTNLVISGATAANAGAYTCTATNAAGATTSTAANLNVVSTANPGRITNLSARAYIDYPDGGMASGVLVAGFAVSGPGTKPLVIRGIGPALGGFGVSGAVEMPSLSLFDSAAPANLITEDTGWQNPPSPPSGAPWLGTVMPLDATAADFSQVGAFALPQGSADSAVKVSLPSGTYTAQVSSVDESAGVVLAEIYDDDPSDIGTQLVNISARSLTETGSQALIGGFEIYGSSAETVLIRASGPALTALGIAQAATDAQLMLYDSANNLIASNAKWAGDPQIAATAALVGAFAWNDTTSADSALLITLAPGDYTAEVNAEGYGGIALIEVYAVP
jgi:YVTN family beta-propeller protein